MKKSRFDFSLNVKIYKKQDKSCDFRKDYHLIKKMIIFFIPVFLPKSGQKRLRGKTVWNGFAEV